MRNRSNPWPAFVDLFASIMVITFAGFVIFAAAIKSRQIGLDVCREKLEKTTISLTKLKKQIAVIEVKRNRLNLARQRADQILNKVRSALTHSGLLKNRVRSCGPDACLDLYIHFPLNQDIITSEEERRNLALACRIIRDHLDALPDSLRTAIQIVIEGHTDSQPARLIHNPRKRMMFNWVLSGRRAASVLYEFSACGLRPPDYNIVSRGYADTMPLCRQRTEKCYARNRRTTLRLSIDLDRLMR